MNALLITWAIFGFTVTSADNGAANWACLMVRRKLWNAHYAESVVDGAIGEVTT